MPLCLDDVVLTKAGTLHLPGCKYLGLARDPERLAGPFVLFDEDRFPQLPPGYHLCSGCTLPALRDHLGIPRRFSFPPSPVCVECRGPLPTLRKGPKCARCAKRDWRSRRTAEQLDAARAADRERKRRNSR